MKGYVIGYNGKFNFGDDLMLSSNIKFLHRLGYNEVIVLNWSRGPTSKSAKMLGKQSYYELSGRFFVLVWHILASCLICRSFVLIGGGNLFDSKIMGRRLFFLAVLANLLGGRVYLRGVGFSTKRWFSNALLRFRHRFRDQHLGSSANKQNDTAFWTISTELTPYALKLKDTKKRYDWIVFPRYTGSLELMHQVVLISKQIPVNSSVCIYSMDIINLEFEKILVSHIEDSLVQKGCHVETKVYEKYSSIIFDMFCSENCIAARHAGIVWKRLRDDSSLYILSYSKKHIYEFSKDNVTLIGSIGNEVD